MGIPARYYLNAPLGRLKDVLASVVRRPFALSLCGGILALLAFYLPGCWWLTFVALVPFLHAVRSARSRGAALMAGAIFGVVLLGGTTFATLSALVPESITGLTAPASRFLVVLSWLTFFLPMVPSVMVWGALARVLKPFTPATILFLAVAWVVLEHARMMLFNIATSAPGVHNPLFFSAGFLGYPLADSTSFLQLAALGGVSLMSFVAACVGCAVYGALVLPQTLRVRAVLALMLAIVVAALVPVPALRASFSDVGTGVPISVGFMSLTVPDRTTTAYHYSSAYRAQLREAIAALRIDAPDLIVLPEGAAYFRERLFSGGPYAPEPILILDSDIVAGTVANENVAIAGLLGAPGGTKIRAKSIVAAQGEYVINWFTWLAAQIGFEKQASEARSAQFVATSEEGGVVSLPGGARASVLFCVEMLAPGIGRTHVAREGSGLLIFLLAHGQFRDAWTLERDTLRFLKVRTVEAGVPSLASADHTLAYALDAYGRVQASLGTGGQSETGVVRISLAPPTPVQ